MRKFILPAIVAIGLGAATPAMAYDTGDQISMQVALDVASDLGVVTVSHTNFLGDEWEIEGATAPVAGCRSTSMPERARFAMSTAAGS